MENLKRRGILFLQNLFWSRVRLIPLIVFFGGLMLSFKVRNIWDGALGVDTVEATEEQKPAEAGSVAGSDAGSGAEPTPGSSAGSEAGADAGSVAGSGEAPKKEGAKSLGAEFDPINMTPEQYAVLNSLGNRQDDLNKKEENLKAQAKAMEVQKKLIEEELAALKAEGTKVQKNAQEETKKEADKITRLVKVYEGMKPDKAALILKEMDPKLSVAILALMKEQKVALILSNMDAAKAQTLTESLAKHESVPEAGTTVSEDASPQNKDETNDIPGGS